MTISEDQRRWWGWGREDFLAPETKGLFAFLAQRIGPWPEQTLPLPNLEEIELRPAEISSELTADLTRIVGPDNVRTDRRTRIFHALGRSYRDLIRIRLGHVPAPPDAVVYPESHDQVRLILDSAARHRAAIVPFGGGSSVVGGVELDAGLRPNICLDLTRMNRILALDSKSLTARVQTGIFGPGLEEALSKEGFTLGHFPQSFEFSTLGGWIAARGAGHKSTRYGKIEDMVLALRLALPGSEIQTPRVPAAAAGGDLTGLLIGSEGALGVITEAEIKIRPLPDKEWFTSFLFPNFEAGLAAVRRMLAQGLRPAMLRLSDPTETAALLAEAGADKTSAFQKTMLDHVAPRYLDLRGIRLDKACLLLAAGEGLSSEAKAEKRAVTRVCRAHGAVGTGASPALAWHKTRYTTPYMRDDMITAGLFIETLETAATWDALPDLCSKVQAALDEALSWSGVTGLVMTHLSHAYPEGANLYFTFIAPMVRGREEEQWRRAKEAATRAILDGGGALSHHHGVGRDHKAWLQEYWGRGLVEVFKAAKAELDPLAIVNPGAVFNPDLSSLKPIENRQPFSPRTRAANIDRFESEVFDLLVVGGGVVGCGVAWDASLRGLSVALVEKDDFASGTSGKSSRMIHGGLRYLKMLDLKLVRESLSERRNLMRIAPHLVRPVKFLLPVFKGQGDSRTVINLGLWAYETLAGHKKMPPHENLTAQEALKREPSIASGGLEGGLVYYDGLTDDARLTLETAKAAARAGAAVANYVEAVRIPFGDNEVRACLKDRLTGREIILKARTAVNAAGVWADRVRAAGAPQAGAVLRPAKGIHIVFPRSLKPISHVIILKGSDGRPLFAVPLGKMIYVGTTDSDYQGDLDKVHAQADEVEYLLEAFNLAFSGPPVTRNQVTASWAGLRPLVAGVDGKETRDISREHEISVEGNRLVTVSGGKLTTFRLMAAQTVDKVFSLLQPEETPQAPTTGLPLCQPRPAVIDKDGLPPQVMARLNEKYGRQAADIIALAQAPLLAVELDHELGLIAAEVYWAVQEEMAMTLPDAMVRRLGLTYLTPDNGLSLALRIARLMAGLLDWTPEETQDQLRAYKDLVNQELSFRVL